MILNEPDEPRIAAALVDASRVRMSAANWLEVAIVVDSGKSRRAEARFENLSLEPGAEVMLVTVQAASRCRDGHGGDSRGNHRAQLNYRDRLAYAVAKISGVPPPFSGNDFAPTDVEPALKD